MIKTILGDDFFSSDYHVHTNLSLCAPETTMPSDYIEACRDEGITTIGFSNHIYYPDMVKNMHTDVKTGAEYALKIKDQLSEFDSHNDIKVLVGAEIETVYGMEPSMSYEEARNFDYVLLAASHIMNLPGYYDTEEYMEAPKLRERTLERFEYACSLKYPVPVGICHPLYAICSPCQQETVDGISDKDLSDCFSLAAKNGISIEVHACVFRRGTALDESGLSPSYLRFLRVAKECGCSFHMGSDTHDKEGFYVHDKLREAARRTGIC